jgi:hypothetical protein
VALYHNDRNYLRVSYLQKVQDNEAVVRPYFQSRTYSTDFDEIRYWVPALIADEEYKINQLDY